MQEKNMNENQIKDSMNLIEILNLIKKDWKLIIVIAASFTIASLAYILQTDDIYKSSTQLVISKTLQTKSSTGIGSQYSGLASLAGVNISGGADQSDFVVARINSRDFFFQLLDNKDVLPSMFAAKEYDRSKQILIYDQNIYDSKTGEWLVEKPTNEQAYEYFHSQMLWIRKQGDTKYINMTVKHISPYFAERMLSLIVDKINQITREDDFNKSKVALDYYKEALGDTTIKEVRSTISSLIEGQIQTQMLSLTKDDYIVEYIDNPFVPEFPDSLSKKVMTVLCFIMGLFIGIFYILTRAYLRFNT